MFELNQAIKHWVASFADQQTMTDSDLQELETHLREEIDHLILAGLSEEEALLIAAGRLGDAGDLSAEFAKVNTGEIWKRRAFWALAGILVSILASSVSGIVSGGLTLLLMQIKTNMYITGVMGSLLDAFAFLLLLFLLFLGIRKSDSRLYERKKPIRLLLTSAAVIFLLRCLAFSKTVILARICMPEMFGQHAIAYNITSVIWTILWPFVLAVLLLVLWPSRTRTV